MRKQTVVWGVVVALLSFAKVTGAGDIYNPPQALSPTDSPTFAAVNATYSATVSCLWTTASNGDLQIKCLEKAPGAATGALAGGGAGNVNNGTHSYKVTFVTAGGETEAGTISNTVTVTDKTADGKVALSAIPTGSPVVTARKIYRTVAGNTGSYKLLTTIADNSTTTYTDNTADAGLGAVAPSANTALDVRATLVNATGVWSTVGP